MPAQEVAIVTGSERRTRRSLSLRTHLVILVLAAMLPVFAFAAFVLARFAQSEQDALQRNLLAAARTISLVVDREIGRTQAMLTVLADAPALQSGDLRTFSAEAVAASAGGRPIVLSDPTGRELINTDRPAGAGLPQRGDLAALRQVVETGRPQVSDLYIGAVTRRPLVTVNVPVLRGGEVIYVLDAAIEPASLDRILLDQRLPPDWTAALIDRSGFTISRTHDPEDSVGKFAAPDLLARIARGEEGWFSMTNQDGREVSSALDRSVISGWSVVIGVPRGIVAAPLRRLERLLGIVGAILLATGLVLALVISRRIAGPIRSLRGPALALGRGEMPDGPLPGLHEADEVGNALAASAHRLRQSRLRREAAEAAPRREEATAGKQAEEALRQSEQRYRSLVEERTRELADMNRLLGAETEARQQAQQSLRQAQKIEAIGQLLGGLAHDLNNLLATTLGDLELVEKMATEDAARRLLGNAQRAAERGAKLAEQLLAFARKQRLRPRPVDVNRLVSEMGDLLQRTIGAGVEIVQRLDRELWRATVDPNQLELVVLNLAINARDAMPAGGTLTIETTNIPAGDSAMPASLAPVDYVRLTVADTGVGMTETVLAHAAEPFFTTKPVGKGSGLGLSMVFGVARQSGGGVEIVSAIGEGTAIHVFLPRSADRDDHDDHAEEGPPAAAPGSASENHSVSPIP